MRLKRLLATPAGVAWCTFGRLASAQLPGIGVDPHMLVLTNTHPSAEMTILNPRPGPALFTVDLRFGYAASDAAGRLRVELGDDGAPESAARWVTPYPSRFVLRGGSSRTVRLVARPVDSLAAGEYWARVVVHSRDTVPPGPDTTGVRVRLALETATIVPLFFRVGDVKTSVVIDSLDARLDGDSVEVSARMTRGGDAAFVGVAHIAVRDSSGKQVVAVDRQLAVYKSLGTRWRIPLPWPLRAGPCSVTLRLATDRHDVDRKLLLGAPDAMREVLVRAGIK